MDYLLTGQEGYLKCQFIEKLKKSILKTKNALVMDFDLFRGGEKDTNRILDSLRSQPFASQMRLIVIKDVDKFSSKEKDSILNYLKSPASSTILVLESSSPESDKILKEISKFARPVRCNRLREKDLSLWIKDEFALRGKKISVFCANIIRELARGGDLFLLKNEIDKITSFAKDIDEITEYHIEAVLGKTAYKTAFELADLVLDKRIDKILVSIGELLRREKPHQILNLLAWQFRNFIKIKDLPKNLSVERIADELGISLGFARNVLQEKRRFTRRNLKEDLETVLEADFSIKRGKVDPRHALERALVKLCR